jgi:tetratricopeptide (TPR) repeat protein
LSRVPADIDFLVSKASIQEHQGNLQGSADTFALALRASPESATIRLRRAAVLSELQRFDEALAECSSAIASQPSLAAAYACRSDLYARTGRLQDALKDLTQAFRLDPNLKNAAERIYTLSGLIEMSRNEAKAAEEAASLPQPARPAKVPLAKASVQHEQSAASPELRNPAATSDELHAKGRKYISEGNFKLAIIALTKALELNPGAPTILNERGYARMRSSDYGGAIADFTSAIDHRPNYGNAYWNRAAAKSHIGDKEGARSDRIEAARCGWPPPRTLPERNP